MGRGLAFLVGGVGGSWVVISGGISSVTITIAEENLSSATNNPTN